MQADHCSRKSGPNFLTENVAQKGPNHIFLAPQALHSAVRTPICRTVRVSRGFPPHFEIGAQRQGSWAGRAVLRRFACTRPFWLKQAGGDLWGCGSVAGGRWPPTFPGSFACSSRKKRARDAAKGSPLLCSPLFAGFGRPTGNMSFWKLVSALPCCLGRAGGGNVSWRPAAFVGRSCE